MTPGNEAVVEDEPPASFKGELAALFRLGWPMITTQFFIMATGFLDTAMAGHYDAVDLAGVAMAGHILWPFFMLLSGVTLALTPIVAQLRGAGQTADSGARIRQGLWITLATSTALVLVLQNCAPLFYWAEIDPEVTRVALGYLDAVSWGIPPIVVYVALRNTSEGLGKTLPPMIIAGSVLPLNAFLNYGFIYGEFGFPELGGVGCGWATAIVFWLELGLMLIVIRRPFFRATQTFSQWSSPNVQEMMRIVAVGLPIGLVIFLEMAVFAVIGFLIGRMGVTELAAHTVAGNVNWMTYVLPSTLGAAAGIRVGFFVGARNLDAARFAAMTAFKFAFGYALVVSVLLIAFRHHIVLAYSNDPAVLSMAATLLLFIAVYQLVDDTQAVAGGALRGFKDTRVPMIYALVGYWVLALPVGAALANGEAGFEPLGVYGYWVGLTLGLTAVAIAIGIRLHRTSANPERIYALARG